MSTDAPMGLSIELFEFSHERASRDIELFTFFGEVLRPVMTVCPLPPGCHGLCDLQQV